MTSFALGTYRCRYLNVGSFEMNADALLESPPVPELELVHAAIAKATTAIPPTGRLVGRWAAACGGR